MISYGPTMLEGYRTLRTLHRLAGEEFTVDDLAVAAGVKPETIRTILARESRYVEEVRRVPTGKRGGRPKVYRLREESESELRERLEAVEAIGDAPRETGVYGGIPTSVLAAEELLAAEPSDDESAASLEFVPVALAEARAQLGRAASAERRGELQTHIATVETLTSLHELEGAARAGRKVPSARLAELRHRAEWLAEQLATRDPGIWERVEDRLARSPLAPALTRLPAVELISVQAERSVTDLVAGVLGEVALEVKRSTRVPARPPKGRVKLGVLVLGSAARPTEILHRLAARRARDERLIVVDAVGRGTAFAHEVSRHSMLCIPQKDLTRESFAGAVRVALGQVPEARPGAVAPGRAGASRPRGLGR
jgi:hypothetical protein